MNHKKLDETLFRIYAERILKYIYDMTYSEMKKE